MFKLIVGVDDRDEALDALALARDLSKIEGAEVIVGSAFLFRGAHLELAFPEALQLFRERVEDRAGGALAGTTYRIAEIQDTPARGLLELAEETAADLIVVGSSCKGALGRVLPGSVGELLLAGAPCPVAVAPRGYAKGEHEGLQRVGVGQDGRPEADLAASEAIRIAKRAGAKLEVVAVAPGEGLDALSDSEVADALIDHCASVDLLVLGSRGYGPLRRVLLGSTSARVIRSAPCPVIVVPRGAEERVRDHAGAATIR